MYIESDQQYTWKKKKLYGQIKTDEERIYRHGNAGDYYPYFTKEEPRKLFNNYKFIRSYFKNRKFYLLLQKI